ncbi:MAG: hypothetical protein ABII82_20255 [Verrucomicrobiota bacterium]
MGARLLNATALFARRFSIDPHSSSPRPFALLFPRAQALTEVAWTPRERRDYASFTRQLYSN